MSDLKDKVIKAVEESEENKLKLLHNRDCNLEDIQPYDNEALLDMISCVDKEIELCRGS